jgi:hypothetical protein
MTTIVSAFISNVNKRSDRDIKKYYELGKYLLLSSTPKIIFVDEIMFQMIQNTDYNKENTNIIKIKKETSYLYNYLHLITKFALDTDNQNKDSLEYMFTMCNKTEFMRQAIELNTFTNDHFIWIDFGIKHIFKCSDNEFIEKINHLQSKKYDKIRIASIWNLDNLFNIYNIDLYKSIAWYFAGGVFGGHAKTLTQFADLMKEKCIEIITTKNTIMWEVNIWYLIYNENKELFDTYYGNHDNTIIDKF